MPPISRAGVRFLCFRRATRDHRCPGCRGLRLGGPPLIPAACRGVGQRLQHRDRLQFVAPDAPVYDFVGAGGSVKAPTLVFTDQRDREGPFFIADDQYPGVFVFFFQCHLLLRRAVKNPARLLQDLRVRRDDKILVLTAQDIKQSLLVVLPGCFHQSLRSLFGLLENPLRRRLRRRGGGQ